MSLITRIRKGKAAWWKRTGVGADGKPTYAAPIIIKCRWDEGRTQMIDVKGVEFTAKSVAYVDRVMDRGDALMRLDETKNNATLMDSLPAVENALADHDAELVVDFVEVQNLRYSEKLLLAAL